MSKDVAIIKEIEKNIGKELELLPLDEIYYHENNSYAIDESGRLTGLNLNECQLTDLSPLQGLSRLTRLSLRDNQLTGLSPLQGLSRLNVLDLGDNQLTDLSPLQGLSQLTKLYLRNNQLTDLSPLYGLRQLTGLNLSGNQLTDLSPLHGLRQLTGLNLSGIQLADLSPLQELSRLRVLMLGNNQLTDLSPLQELIRLRVLKLGDNQLTDLGPLQELSQLRELYLINNRIKELPEAFAHMDMKIDVDDKTPIYDGLYLSGNPLESPPPEIIRKGKEAMWAWFRSQEEEQKQALNEVKVVLVGEGSAGKTSLVKQLMGQDFDPNESQTHGINIDPWSIKTNGTPIIAHLWDFGGQEIMHATHQFFLSKRSLYILVLDGRKDEKAEYWLKHIQSFGGDSPTLVVINKIDQNPGHDVNRPFLQHKYKNIKNFFPISCAQGTGIEAFREALVHELGTVEMIHQSWAKSWFNVKTALQEMTDDFIGFDKYQEICQKEEIKDPATQEILVEFLHDLGVILHFKEFDLRDTHVLDPGWATGAVYKIINSKQVADAKGVLHLKDLDKILAKEKGEYYHYPRTKYRYILTLMNKFEICYPIDDHTVLIPDLLAVPEPAFEFDYDGALAFIIQYDFLPPSVLPRFIVNMHQEIKGNLQWRTGVVLEDKDFKATAVVKADHEARRIYIYVTGDQKRDYFALLLATLRRINRGFEKLKTTELIPMPDDPQITANYKQLIQFEQMGIEDFVTGESDSKYKVNDLLGTIASPNATEEEILKLLKKLVNENDTEESATKKLSDAFIFQPKILGVSIDVNKLIHMVLPKKNDQD
jgi:internalin A